MSLKKKVFHGALWAGAAQVVSMGCTFLLTIILARGLSPADYGLYFVVLNTVVILANVGNLGMGRVVVRFAAQRMLGDDETGLRHLVVSCLRTVVIGALVTSLLFWWCGGWFFDSLLRTQGLAVFLPVIAAWLFTSTVQGQLAESFRGLHDIRLASLFGGVQSSGMLTAMAVCMAMAALWLGGALSLSWAFKATSLASMVVVASGLVQLAVLLPRSAGKASAAAPGESTGEALREGWSYWLTAIIVTLRLQGGSWLAGRFDSADHVALYAVAQRMMLLLVAPMIISNAVLPPVVAQLHASGQLDRLGRVIRSVGGLILLPSLLLMAVLVIGGHPLLRLLFGPYYVQGYPLLVILCVGQTFNLATGAWQVVMPMAGIQRHMLVTGLIAMTVLLSLGIVLGHFFGVTGVAIAIAASIVVTNLTGMLFVHAKLGIWTYASLDLATLKEAIGLVTAKLSRRKQGAGAAAGGAPPDGPPDAGAV